MRNAKKSEYIVKLEVWETRVLGNGERHLDYRLVALETRYASFEDAKVQFAKLDLGRCWKRRCDDGVAALKSVWYQGSCIAFDSYDTDDRQRELAFEELGGFELEEVELVSDGAALDQAVGAHISGRTPSSIFQACS